jgi:hypothetical protein
MTMTIYPDEDLLNADWTKQTWDLPFKPDSPEQAEWCRKSGISEGQFRKLPVYQHAKGAGNATQEG